MALEIPNSVVIQHLTDAYVRYELRSRKSNLRGSTLRSRKKKLLEILDSESPATRIYENFMSFEHNIAECKMLLEEAKTDIARDKERLAESIEIRMFYLEKRIDSIDISEDNAGAKKQVEDLLKEIGAVISELGNVSLTLSKDELANEALHRNASINNQRVISYHDLHPHNNLFNSIPLHAEPNRGLHNPFEPQSFQPIPPQFFEQQHRGIPPRSTVNYVPANQQYPIYGANASNQNYSMIPPHPEHRNSEIAQTIYTRGAHDPKIWAWDIKFSADDKSKSAIDFIQKIKDYARSRKVGHEEVLESMTGLLDGSALKWFRVEDNRDRFKNYQDFVLRLLEEFEPFYRFDTRLEIIKKRHQKPDESVVMYFAHMQNEFLTLANRPSERDQINIIRRNLLPKYITELGATIYTSISHLKEDCKQLELNAELIKHQNRLPPRLPNVANSFPQRYGSFRYQRPETGFLNNSPRFQSTNFNSQGTYQQPNQNNAMRNINFNNNNIPTSGNTGSQNTVPYLNRSQFANQNTLYPNSSLFKQQRPFNPERPQQSVHALSSNLNDECNATDTSFLMQLDNLHMSNVTNSTANEAQFESPQHAQNQDPATAFGTYESDINLMQYYQPLPTNQFDHLGNEIALQPAHVTESLGTPQVQQANLPVSHTTNLNGQQTL